MGRVSVGRFPVLAAAAACLAAAAASLALPGKPQYDPEGWVIWGRELLHGTLDTAWYPSWKPLPVLVTTPAALAGGAAPTVWLLVERTAAIAGLLLAGLLAWRAAGAAAGVLAAGAVLLLPGWSAYALTAAVEPVVIACVLGALACRLAGRTSAALVLLALAALGRVEAWPLLALAGIAWARGPRVRLLALGLVALVPVAWLAGDWAGAGSPMYGGMLARRSKPAVDLQTVAHPELRVLANLTDLVRLPLLVLAVVGLVLAVRARSRSEPALAVGAALWIAADVALVLRGYPAEPRFLLPAGAFLVVLAALGAVRGLRAIDAPVPVVVAAVVGALAITAVVRAPAMAQEGRRIAAFEASARQLDGAVALAGGPEAVRACGGAATVQPFRAQLAWELGTGTDHVRRTDARGFLFAPAARWFRAKLLALASKLERVHGTRLRELGRTRDWLVLRTGCPARGASPVVSRRTACSPRRTTPCAAHRWSRTPRA
jgi:hypothetical protein